MPYDHIKIAVPKSCNDDNQDGWKYGNAVYSIVTNLDSYNPNKHLDRQKTRIVVSVKEKRKEIGYFIY